MKKVMLMTLSFTLLANSAMALDANDIRNLRDDSKTEALEAVANERAEIVKLTEEIGSLQAEISLTKEKIARGKNVRNVSLVVTAGLAATTGWIFRRGQNLRDFNEVFVRILGGIITGTGTLVAGGVTGYKQYMISVNADKLDALENELAEVKARLNDRLSALQ